jgi:hypothetical protein
MKRSMRRKLKKQEDAAWGALIVEHEPEHRIQEIEVRISRKENTVFTIEYIKEK